ncbi:shikimate kinase [Methanohalophilus sp.]
MIITLIGMAGVGKSTIGKLLASHLGYNFVDVDDLIKQRIGGPLQDYLDEEGDSAFIKVEEDAILNLDLKDNMVIATGGSAIYSEVAMKILSEKSLIILLDDTFPNIRKRISHPWKRGLVGLWEKGIKKLYLERWQLYRQYADIVVDINGMANKKKVVDDIVEKSKKLYNSTFSPFSL